jgi:hypothetical protein
LKTKNCSNCDEIKHNTELKIDSVNKQLQSIRNVYIISVRKETESLEKQESQLKQQLEIVRKKHFGSERTAKVMIDLIQININGKVNLSLEKRALEEDNEHQKNQIRLLLTEKDRFEHDSEVANQQYYTSLEELKL